MKSESIEELKQQIVTTYRNYGDKNILTIGKLSYTGNEIATEVANETQFGLKHVDNIIQLTIDLLTRDKL